MALLDPNVSVWMVTTPETSYPQLTGTYDADVVVVGAGITGLTTALLDEGESTIVYCRIGERSSHTWFVLHGLLGLSGVKNYDGSRTEYGSLVGVPIELGSKGLSSCGAHRKRPSKCRRARI